MSLWRELPTRLEQLRDLALDLRWTWSHQADALWERIDAGVWERTRNPWTILSDVPARRFTDLATDVDFLAHLDRCVADRHAYLTGPSWFAATYGSSALRGAAYLSMEFGLGDALPLYAGGLGVLAGDLMKTTSDLGIPVIGVGLLFQQGYFRQMIDAAGWQHEAYPYNEPATMPVEPVLAPDGSRLHISIELPGRSLHLRIWRALIGRVTLYLLDSNSTLNSAADRGITGALYAGGTQMRLMQEIALGIGGWRLVEALHPEVEVCHMNEGHAAFAVLERARSLAARMGISFREALWATRAGNVFTTHTPVDAGFDRFPLELLEPYRPSLKRVGIDPDIVLALGQEDGTDDAAPFNMAYLAARGSLTTFAVSRRHGVVSRRIFQPLYPCWPQHEVPISHVTNGVHVPTWDSQAADAIWTEACGKDRWRCFPEDMRGEVARLSDDMLWTMRCDARKELMQRVRAHLRRHLSSRGSPAEVISLADRVLDLNALTLGFARRFTGYKRPNLLLHDRDRLARLLSNQQKPVQIVLAGKAHPADIEGKQMIQSWLTLAQLPALRDRIVFLEDYDLSVAQELTQGVDVWINTPRPPWEACGTSGMKVLVNGGLNLSVRDGWWDEAFAPDLGWTIDGSGNNDADDAERLVAALEAEIIPEFYERDAAGLPRTWLARIRRSMAELTPRYSSTRMLRDYVETAYLPAATTVRRRLANSAEMARSLAAWQDRIQGGWPTLRIGTPEVRSDRDTFVYTVPVCLGTLAADDVLIEVYADPISADACRYALSCSASAGADGTHLYSGIVPASRPALHYTVRAMPRHPDATAPAELPMILWQK